MQTILGRRILTSTTRTQLRLQLAATARLPPRPTPPPPPHRKMSLLRHQIQNDAPAPLSESVQSKPSLAELMNAMHVIAPLSLADTSWDNVGLLLESPSASARTTSGVHLCIDLTTSVAEEAIKDSNVSVVLCYHPIIFRGLKSLTMGNSQQASLLRLVAAGISVYSPHTSLDATQGGINDWLAVACSGGHHDDLAAFMQVPRPCRLSKNTPKGYEEAGMGRTFELADAVSPSTLVERLKKSLHVDHLQIALPHGCDANAQTIKSIAVCAGSGGSVLAGDNSDAWVTGEMSHVRRRERQWGRRRLELIHSLFPPWFPRRTARSTCGSSRRTYSDPRQPHQHRARIPA